MNATPVRAKVAMCRDAAGWRPRLLAAVLRLDSTLAFTAERQGVGQTESCASMRCLWEVDDAVHWVRKPLLELREQGHRSGPKMFALRSDRLPKMRTDRLSKVSSVDHAARKIAMPKRATAVTGAAGEHFIAYKLSVLGFPVAMTRGGSPTVDLMVGDLAGHGAVSIQVKTSTWAERIQKKKETRYWEWDVGRKALSLRGDSIFYAFVDLRCGADGFAHPDTYIVPSQAVAEFVKPDWSRFMFWFGETKRPEYLERWDLLENRLVVTAAQPAVAADGASPRR